jgi:hypothetical protein
MSQMFSIFFCLCEVDGLLHEEVNSMLGTVCSYLEELFYLANENVLDETVNLNSFKF